jgi:hypothetical protein
MNKLFIIAGNYNQYVNWKNRNYPELLLNGQIEKIQDLVYVSSIDQLKGYNNPKGMFIGTWYRREDMEYVLGQLQVAGTLNVTQVHRLLDIIEDHT